MYSSPIYYLAPLLVALWFYCIYDIVQGKFDTGKEKLTYFLLVLILPIIGIPVYLIVGKRHKRGKLDKSLF